MEKKLATATTTTITNSETNGIKPALQIERVLTYLVTHGSINRLEAEKAPVFAHAINSTMSREVKKRLNLGFTSIPEKGIGYSGLPAIYHRYTLTEQSTETAKQLINEYRIKRGAQPILWKGVA